MKLDYVAITGADDAVSVAELNSIARTYPHVEFALLLLPGEMGSPRCPSVRWIDGFREHYRGAHKAIHLCGPALAGFCEDDAAVFSLMRGFSRIQLNLNFGDVAGRYSEDDLIAAITANPEWEFIIQYTPAQAHLLPRLAEIPNHSILFDASAGRGIAPQDWPAPLPGHYCGYAGGLGPANIAANLRKIAKINQGHTWIDMESGVRSEDRFDLAKVRQVLEACAPYF